MAQNMPADYQAVLTALGKTGDYKDSRALLWNTALFKYLMPVVVVLAIWGGFTHGIDLSG